MLVTICVPAYNAQSTLDETLWSIRRQTFANFEAIVVDDGSVDDTAEIAAAHARADERIKLISKKNGGVASARNLALASARGLYFANLDADDLWHPKMLEKQHALIEKSDKFVVLCYTWFAYIDERGRIVSVAEPSESGDVIHKMCTGNLVGNGSSALMHTATLRKVGGWDPTLRGRNDDYNTFFLLAEQGEFAVVRSYLLGYRQVTGANMTGNAKLMVSSYDEVVSRYRPKYPQYGEEFESGRIDLMIYLFDKAVLNRRWSSCVFLFREIFSINRRRAVKLVFGLPLILARMLIPIRARSMLRPGSAVSQLKGKVYTMADLD